MSETSNEEQREKLEEAFAELKEKLRKFNADSFQKLVDKGVVKDGGRCWKYTLQHELENHNDKIDPEILSVSKQLRVKHIRASSKHEGVDRMFHLICAMCGVDAGIIDRAHADDFDNLMMIVDYISGN